MHISSFLRFNIFNVKKLEKMKVLNKTCKVLVPESQNHKVRNSIPNIMCHYRLVSD